MSEAIQHQERIPCKDTALKGDEAKSKGFTPTHTHSQNPRKGSPRKGAGPLLFALDKDGLAEIQTAVSVGWWARERGEQRENTEEQIKPPAARLNTEFKHPRASLVRSRGSQGAQRLGTLNDRPHQCVSLVL